MQRCVGIVLAGGRSTRMGGHDKALLTLGGRALVRNAVERLSPQVGDIAVNSNADPASLPLFGVPVIPDADEKRSGPLAGVLSGLRWASSLSSRPSAIITAAVDTPFFPTDLAERLRAASDDQSRTVIAATGGQVHPTFALWPVALADDLERFLADARSLSVMAFAERDGFEVVDFGQTGTLDPFFNINTPADLAVAEAALGSMP